MIDLESLANIGEVVGAAAVVASLLYLAVQVRQSTKAQQTENYARALDRVSSIQSLLSQDSDISRIFAVGVQDTSSLTPLEKIRFTWSLYETFDSFEFMFYTYRNDEIPEEVWSRWSNTVGWWLSFPGVRTWWHCRPVQFTDSFTEFVESLLQETPTSEAAKQRWEAFIGKNAETTGPASG